MFFEVFDIYPIGVYTTPIMNTENKKVVQRINRVIGQLEGIKKMIDTEKKCTDTLVQFKAANSALENATREFAKNQITSCMENLDQNKKEAELEKLLSSLIK